ncbi:MAG: hypothetical protein R3252_07405 [Robiginitalea sp.]|nr:hypothetical protein [Robiginitalea sp.]
MRNRKTTLWIRKAHRYLGIFLGVQFLMWTLSGMYFSWTDLDEIHGDHFKKDEIRHTGFTGLPGTEQLEGSGPIHSLQLMDIGGTPYYWIDEAVLFNAVTGKREDGISREQALQVASRHMRPELEVAEVRMIREVDAHHEYRGKPLPAYEIRYNTPENLKVYVAAANGSFQTVRHRNWRWFDFLWMTHTMDYNTRDDFNTTLLRAFSLMGLITVLSGFVLWYISSPTVHGWRRKKL